MHFHTQDREPGGDIKVVTTRDLEGWNWSEPRILLRQTSDGIPKVIANKLVELSTAEWVLPFWRERPLEDTCPNLAPVRHEHQRTGVGVLVSLDQGETWNTYGDIKSKDTMLLEPTLVELMEGDGGRNVSKQDAPLMMLLRSGTGCIYKSMSYNKGRIWSAAESVNAPNPNTKFHVIKLKLSRTVLAMVYNNHKRTHYCRACRTHLHVALSYDGGESWTNVASLDDSNEAGVRVHYPTIMQVDHRLLIVYSRFYLGQEQGGTSSEQGIILQEVDLTTLKDLPHLADDVWKRIVPADKSNKAAEVNLDVQFEAQHKVVEHFLGAQNPVTLRRYQRGTWQSTVNAIMARYDLEAVMGLDAGEKLRRNKKLATYTAERIRAMLPAIGEDFPIEMRLANGEIIGSTK
mmetsp:Transcript_17451/g.29315  ORF Transcript_17451/g.29315 Transcript_17451/m.29315 type:complete len:403 (-) Transcript_17451:253-1461(-)